jgi:Rad3-related DNA helicase
MNDVYDSLCGMTSVVEINVSEGEGCGESEASLLCMRQKNGMDEAAREKFLQEFETQGERTLVAFCVMGGIFGEGIDLKKDQLIGAIVVGTGLPQISNEREILKNYYDEQSGNGFDYAFRYPGINKVLQAAGRVIRTAEDRGVILLLDERFRQRDYSSLYPREWEKRSYCTLDTVEELVRGFWEQEIF